MEVDLDLGDGLRRYHRDTNVMPQWAGSSWYQLRYIDPTNSEAFCAKENEAYWVGPRPELHGPDDPGGVDLYVGGVEHAVLHLLYSRFWHKVLFDLGLRHLQRAVPAAVQPGLHPGLRIHGCARGVRAGGGGRGARTASSTGSGEASEVFQEYGKMGKSLKNAVAPDQICDDYGADTLRVYEMSMGPLDQSRPWATKDVVGAHRFLQRLWRVVLDEETGKPRVTEDDPRPETLRLLHKTIDGRRGGLRVRCATIRRARS